MTDKQVERQPTIETVQRRDAALLGRPTLKTVDVVAQALAVGPIASIGLGGFLLAGYAGAAAPFVVVVALLGAVCLGWVVSLYARSYAGAGSVYEYVAATLGKRLGVACAGLEFFVGPVGLGTLYLLFGVLWQAFARAHLGFDPGWWSGGLILAAAVFGLQHHGIRVSTRTQLVLTALSAVPFLVLFAAVVLADGAGRNTVTVFHPDAASGSNLSRSFLFAVLLFAGFEASAAVGEETRTPHRSIPRAMLVAIGASGVFYLLVVYAATVGFGPADVAREWGGNPAGLSVLADRYVGPPLPALIELAILLDIVAVVGGYGNEIGRGLFALARDHLVPRVLATRSRHDTPIGGLAFGTVGGLAVLACATCFEDRFEAVEALAVTLTLANMVVYLTLGVGARRFLVTARRRGPLIAVAIAFPVLGIFGSVIPPITPAGRVGFIVFAGLLATVAAWATFLRYRRPRQLEHAADLALRASE